MYNYMEEDAFDDPLSLLQKVAEYIDNNISTFCALLNGGRPEEFINSIKKLLFDFIFVNIKETGIKDQNGFAVFLEIVTMGFIHLMKKYIQNETEFTLQQIVNEINRIYTTGMPAYK